MMIHVECVAKCGISFQRHTVHGIEHIVEEISESNRLILQAYGLIRLIPDVGNS